MNINKKTTSKHKDLSKADLMHIVNKAQYCV